MACHRPRASPRRVGGAYAAVRNVLYTGGNLGKLVRKE